MLVFLCDGIWSGFVVKNWSYPFKEIEFHSRKYTLCRLYSSLCILIRLEWCFPHFREMWLKQKFKIWRASQANSLPQGPLWEDLQCRRCKRQLLDSWFGKIPWSRKWQPIPVLLPGKFYGQRSLVAIVHGAAESQTCWAPLRG